MEENLNQIICERFGVGDVDVRSYSPLVLAYIGDGIYDLVIRSVVVGKGNTSPNQLHAHTSHIVKAETQSKMIELLQDELTEEEMNVYRRGRNAKSNTMAKNASMSDYRNATGFEALMGYLYLQGQMSRILELVQSGLAKAKMTI
ncbi:MAG: ribonuclease III [Lachnospiraceae bacterium]|nr:ribonuclease III [Lachnospiraceae bacterium]